MAGRWVRLCAVFFLVGLCASRVTLVLHELAGHGGVAVLLGGRLLSYKLFLFGGGWVTYQWGPEQGMAADIAVSLAGIALEIAAATIALVVAWRLRERGAALARVALVGFATADLVHAGFYLAAGTHHGFGDGGQLHAVLGGARALVVWPAAAAVVMVGLVLARRLAVLAGGWVGARSRAGRAAALVAAAAAAAAAHGALTWSERGLVDDATYARIMKPASEYRIERDMAELAAEARRRGEALDEDARSAARAELERRHRGFPLVPVLAIALAIACGAGVWLGTAPRSRPEGERDPPGWRAVAVLASVTAASLLLVAGLSAMG
jgi:hypothetical protein